ncbi:MAG: GAF domain-containing protein, partial [Bacteroidota bacterium]
MPLTDQHKSSISTIDILKTGQQRLRDHLLKDSPLKDILASLIAIVEETSPDMRGAVFLIKPGTNLLFKEVAPSIPDEVFDIMKDGSPLSGDGAPDGISRFVKGQVFTTNMAEDPTYTEFYKTAKQHGISAVWTQQIISKGKVIGVFSLFHDISRTPLKEATDLLDIVSGLAGMAIEIKDSESALKQNIVEQKGREEMLY